MNDIQEQPAQPVQPTTTVSTPTPASVQPPQPVSQHKANPPYMLILGAIVLFIVAFVVVGVLTSKTASTIPTAVNPMPSIAVTPTPVLQQSALASTSAFLEFSRENASFSGILNAFVLQDPTLTAPLFDTDITFTQ